MFQFALLIFYLFVINLSVFLNKEFASKKNIDCIQLDRIYSKLCWRPTRKALTRSLKLGPWLTFTTILAEEKILRIINLAYIILIYNNLRVMSSKTPLDFTQQLILTNEEWGLGVYEQEGNHEDHVFSYNECLDLLIRDSFLISKTNVQQINCLNFVNRNTCVVQTMKQLFKNLFLQILKSKINRFFMFKKPLIQSRVTSNQNGSCCWWN